MVLLSLGTSEKGKSNKSTGDDSLLFIIIVFIGMFCQVFGISLFSALVFKFGIFT